jgi:hypothetical protein
MLINHKLHFIAFFPAEGIAERGRYDNAAFGGNTGFSALGHLWHLTLQVTPIVSWWH